MPREVLGTEQLINLLQARIVRPRDTGNIQSCLVIRLPWRVACPGFTGFKTT